MGDVYIVFTSAMVTSISSGSSSSLWANRTGEFQNNISPWLGGGAVSWMIYPVHRAPCLKEFYQSFSSLSLRRSIGELNRVKSIWHAMWWPKEGGNLGSYFTGTWTHPRVPGHIHGYPVVRFWITGPFLLWELDSARIWTRAARLGNERATNLGQTAWRTTTTSSLITPRCEVRYFSTSYPKNSRYPWIVRVGGFEWWLVYVFSRYRSVVMRYFIGSGYLAVPGLSVVTLFDRTPPVCTSKRVNLFQK